MINNLYTRDKPGYTTLELTKFFDTHLFLTIILLSQSLVSIYTCDKKVEEYEKSRSPLFLNELHECFLWVSF